MPSDVPAPERHGPCLNRRRVLGGAAIAGLGVPVLAACAGGDGTDGGAGDGTTGGGGTPGSGMSGPLAATSEIPVGSGVIFADEGVVVTQPTAGEFRGFSVTCTHQGCPVTEVTETIDCACHGSSFALTDGAPVDGPASRPLAEVAITVDGEQILVG